MIHAVESCPDCGTSLAGGAVVGRRQILDVPLLPATITEHVTLARRCRSCHTTHTPTVDLRGEVLGQQRVSLRLMALIVVLREHHRLPVGQVQRYLETVHQLRLSRGELVAIVAASAARGTQAADAILEAVRASSVVHADETSWREDGQNGYLWSVSSGPLRYFRRGRRHKEMVDDLLGEAFVGVLVTDFYTAYDHYPGPHQRCWAHLLRHVADLERLQPADAAAAWAEAVRQVYRAARDDPGPARRAGRRRAPLRAAAPPRGRAGGGLHALRGGAGCAAAVLRHRVAKYLPELFTFVADRAVSADNNAAERSLRPAAVRRKISGGTRSPAGTATRTTLWSLVDTWQLRGQDVVAACLALLSPTPASSV